MLGSSIVSVTLCVGVVDLRATVGLEAAPRHLVHLSEQLRWRCPYWSTGWKQKLAKIYQRVMINSFLTCKGVLLVGNLYV